MIAATFLMFAPALYAQEAPIWRLTETLRIGALDGPHALSRIHGLTVSPDGRMVFVTQPIEHTIRVFDASSGELLRKIGRHGEGPGEFRMVEATGWVADTLYATDFLLQRISLFSVTGQHLETIRISPPLEPRTRRGSVPIGLTADGNAVSQQRLTSRSIAEGMVTTSPWALVDREGNVLRTLGTRNLKETTSAADVPHGTVYFRQPLSRRSFLALHPDGTSMVVVQQSAGRDPPGTFRITLLRPNGDTTWSRSYRYTPQPLPEEVAAEFVANFARDLEHGLTPGLARETARKFIIIPEMHPPISAVVLGRDDSIWLRREEDGQEEVRWDILNTAGQLQARAFAPEGLSMLYADEAGVWGTVTDEFDVPYVVWLRLER